MKRGAVCRAGARLALALAATLAVAAPAAAVVNCTATSTGIDFGIYDPLNRLASHSTGTVNVSCTLLSGAATTDAVTVTLSTGSSATFTVRTLRSGTSVLNYNVFLSPTYQQVWGNGTGGSYFNSSTLALAPGAPTSALTSILYAQLPPLQDVTPGTYTDTLVLTVSY